MIQFLPSGTTIDTGMVDTSTSKSSTSNTGTAQRDSLSQVLFIIYLEHALKEVRPTLTRPTAPFEAKIQNPVAFSNGVDVMGQTMQILTISKRFSKKCQLKFKQRKCTHQYKKAEKDRKK